MPGTLWHLRAALRPQRAGAGPSKPPSTSCRSWSAGRNDGGAFVTLPQVYTEDADRPGWRHSNLGMYRVQLSGNEYRPDREVGLHYQIHRGIGVHHAAALRARRAVSRQRLRRRAAGHDARRRHAAAGGLAGTGLRRAPGRPARAVGASLPGSSLPIPAEADFCIVGTVDPQRQLPEGPFGDHLGYYSLAHPFPVLNVERVYHRAGRDLAVHRRRPAAAGGHQLRRDHPRTDRPDHSDRRAGVHAVHAVDAAGVHPLLLAIGSERYVPYAAERQPQELLTCANAILGQGQLSLAKYLLIVAQEDDPSLDIHDIPAFLRHLLERVDWRTDLHFQTCTTIDTLDYSGSGLNEGSKLVIAAAGPKRRELPTHGAGAVCVCRRASASRASCLPGILAVQRTAFQPTAARTSNASAPTSGPVEDLAGFPLVLLVDDSDFTARHLNNWLWVTFTRSNPAADVHGIGAFTEQKHWGCAGRW